MTCRFCDEPVLPTDDTYFRDMHRECAIRVTAGSLGHQMGLCCCPGNPGTLDDPPGVSKRDAARAAADLYLRREAKRGKARFN